MYYFFLQISYINTYISIITQITSCNIIKTIQSAIKNPERLFRGKYASARVLLFANLPQLESSCWKFASARVLCCKFASARVLLLQICLSQSPTVANLPQLEALLFFPIKEKDYKTAICYTRVTILYIFTFDLKITISVDKDMQTGFKKNFGKILQSNTS